MKNLVILLAVLAVVGVAQANILSNGDFSLDDGVDPMNAASWTEWNSGGWVNREVNGNGTYGDPANFHMAIGNSGAINNGMYQAVAVPDDGAIYQVTADLGQDAWWKPDAYVKVEFWDASLATLGAQESWIYMADFDTGTPWQSVSASMAAPAGTAYAVAVLGSWTDGNGGTTRFDNVVLEVVPEPATMAILGLGGLFLRRRK